MDFDTNLKMRIGHIAEREVRAETVDNDTGNAVIATERDANGKIIPSTIHAIVEFTVWEIAENTIDQVIEYSNVLIDKFLIAPKVVVIGKEPSKAVQSYIAKSNLEDVTVYVIKGAEWQE